MHAFYVSMQAVLAARTRTHPGQTEGRLTYRELEAMCLYATSDVLPLLHVHRL